MNPLMRAFGIKALRVLRDIARNEAAPTRAPHPRAPHSDTTDGLARPPQAAGTRVLDLRHGLPEFSYHPQPDGDADPGEVCWTWIPYEDDPTIGKDRPVLVLARYRSGFVVAQMTSKDHTRNRDYEASQGRHWVDIGTGSWDRQRRPSEVRIDRLLYVEAQAIRREGATLDRSRFDTVVRSLKALHSK